MLSRNLFAVLAFSLTGFFSPANADIPLTIGKSIGDPSRPAWVRVDLVILPDGEINEAYLGEFASHTLTDALPSITRGCYDSNSVIACGSGPEDSWNTLDTAIEKTVNIFVGTVADSAHGLLHGSLGTLVALEPVELLRKHPLVEKADNYYLHIDAAKFELDDKDYCAYDHHHPALPAIGERVIIFPTILMGPELIVPKAMVIERQDGTVEASSILSDLPADTPFDDILASVKARIVRLR